jgi:hypothetical protein
MFYLNTASRESIFSAITKAIFTSGILLNTGLTRRPLSQPMIQASSLTGGSLKREQSTKSSLNLCANQPA